jgi:DNA-binding Lrp family transcriptional regulator
MPSGAGVALDPLDRRLVAALQVDGRASWRKIAAVLGEPERTVARRGARLLDEGLVTVTGLASPSMFGRELVVVGLHCSPGTVRVAAAALARRADSIFTYVVTGPVDCVAEIACPTDRLPGLLLDELPATPGLVKVSTHPVLRYYRTVHEWQPGILGDDEVRALAEDRPNAELTTLPREVLRLPPAERSMLRALTRDGRTTHEDLARLTGLSEATVRRRVDALRRRGALFIRAVVEPALLGLPVEALLWIRTAPGTADTVGEHLLASPLVRYAAAVMGGHHLLVNVTVPGKAELHDFVTRSPWLADVTAIETSQVIDSLKRSAVLDPRVRGGEPD